MTELENLDLSIENFFRNPESKVAMLTGDWGVGKTYYWKHHLLHKAKAILTSTNVKSYSYVSLFGIGSLSDLQHQVFLNSYSLQDAGTEKMSIENKLSQLALMFRDLEIPNVGTVPIPDELVQSVMNLHTHNTLIVIDDLERKSESILMDELLGYLSFLREEKNCTIFIIYNKAQLEGKKKEDADVLDRYLEKIVDYEYIFNPSPESRIDLVINNMPIRKAIEPIILELNIKNIRILRKITWNNKLILEILKSVYSQLNESLKQDLIRQTTYITAFYNDKSLGIDTRNLRRYSRTSRLIDALGGQKRSKDNNEPQYNYTFMEMDEFIIQVIETGICDTSGFVEHVNELQIREKKTGMRQRYEELWRHYNANFSKRTNEVENHFCSFLDENAESLSLEEISNIIIFLEEIGHKMNDVELIDRHIKANYHKYSKKGLVEAIKIISNDDLHKDVVDFLKAKESKMSLLNTISTIVDRGTWSHEDFDFLDSKSIKDYFEWMKAENSENFLSKLRAFRSYINSTTDEREKSVKDKIDNALTHLAKIDEVNRKRIVEFIFNGSPPEVIKNGEDS